METTAKNKLKYSLAAIVLAVVIVFGTFSNTAEAQVNYGGYAPRTQAETIAYLQGILAQLLLQVQLQQGGSSVYYQPSGFVLGASFSRKQYDVEVGTAYPSTNDDEIRFYGIVDLGGAPYADVWFEYDTDKNDFDERTHKKRVTRDGEFSITVDKDDFDEDEWHYYRAVVESPSGDRDKGGSRTIFVTDGGRRGSSNDDKPDVETFRAQDIDEDSAELNGEVDMNDFRNGIVFFVYGEDEDQVEDIEKDYDEFDDIDEDGDDLQKVKVDSDLDGDERYSENIRGLDDDTEYFFQICVEYEDEDDDEVIECGGVEDFETDRD